MTSLDSGTAPLIEVEERPALTGPVDAAPEGTQPGRWPSWQSAAGLAVFASGAVTAAVWLTLLGRGLTFFFDEWNLVDTRGQSFWTTDLAPHNGQPMVILFLLYRLAFAVVGIDRYWPYLALVVGVNLLCGWLLFVLLRRRISPIVAGGAASILMLLGPAWQDLLWPFQIVWFGSVAGGLGALILLERRQTRADLGAAICLTLSVFCSGVGISVLIGITVELLWRRSSWHRIWVTLAPAALFATWHLTKGRGSTPLLHTNLSTGAHFVGGAAASVLGAATGQGTTVGAILAIALAFLVVVAMVLSPGEAGRLAMAVAGGLSFWLLTLLTRGMAPEASRYLYPGVVFALLAVAELPRLLGSPDRQAADAPGTRGLVPEPGRPACGHGPGDGCRGLLGLRHLA